MRHSDRMMRIGGWMLAMLCVAWTTASAMVCIVRDDKVRAVVVTAAKPSEVAAYAAKELVYHIEKATGQRLQVVLETAIPKGYASRIFVGDTDAARKQGLDPDKLEIEEFIVRTVGSDLYITGKELHPDQKVMYEILSPQREPRNPLSTHNVYSGTLFGVYEVLDSYLGVRWLWPGELGTYVPRKNTIEIVKVDEMVRPRLLYRDLGGWELEQMHVTGSYYGRKITPSFSVGRITEKLCRNLIFPTEEAGYAYGRAVEVYNRRHRRVTPIEEPPRVPRTGHQTVGINDWWAAYGKEHPEWFAMRSDGQRGLKVPRAGAYTDMCISNPELQRFIVEKAWDGGDILQMGEADGYPCECAQCEAMDGPQPKDVPEIVREHCAPRAMGDRYARFWKIIYDMAVKRNPRVRMPVYLYANTVPAPLTGIKLNKNIQGEFVIYGSWSGWYPMSVEEDQWYRKQWLGWANTGIRMFDRSNYLLSNYVTPNVTTWQEGEFLKFACDHEMIGICLQSYTFSWAAHGPMAYMHYRLISKPEMKIKDIRQEYFSAFGPAASCVEQYFDYWENYARTRPAVSSVSTGDAGGALEKLRRPRGHYLAYPPDVYRPAEAILEKALNVARKDPLPEYAKRVEFLRAGIEHAQLSTRIFGLLDYASASAPSGSPPTGNPEKIRQARQAMRELIEFRRSPENLFVSDYMSNALVEQYYIKNITALFEAP